jgi:ABC-type Na+ efflux pump permease subunit
MKFNLSSNSMRLIAAGTIGLFLSSGLITPAFAEVKATDTKKVDSAAVKTTDADFKKLDANADGKISLKEAVKDKALVNVFNVTDTNQDGMLTTDENINYKSALSTMTKENATTTN